MSKNTKELRTNRVETGEDKFFNKKLEEMGDMIKQSFFSIVKDPMNATVDERNRQKEVFEKYLSLKVEPKIRKF